MLNQTTLDAKYYDDLKNLNNHNMFYMDSLRLSDAVDPRFREEPNNSSLLYYSGQLLHCGLCVLWALKKYLTKIN